jgi:hypothetical protein
MFIHVYIYHTHRKAVLLRQRKLIYIVVKQLEKSRTTFVSNRALFADFSRKLPSRSPPTRSQRSWAWNNSQPSRETARLRQYVYRYQVVPSNNSAWQEHQEKRQHDNMEFRIQSFFCFFVHLFLFSFPFLLRHTPA